MEMPRVLETVLLREEGGEAFALEIDSGEVFALNGTAAQILHLCQQGQNIPQITAALLAGLTEPTPAEVVQQDVEETLQTFVELGLCTFAPLA